MRRNILEHAPAADVEGEGEADGSSRRPNDDDERGPEKQRKEMMWLGGKGEERTRDEVRKEEKGVIE
jgi:hypothetical protein